MKLNKAQKYRYRTLQRWIGKNNLSEWTEAEYNAVITFLATELVKAGK